jgi:hypothetical protein
MTTEKLYKQIGDEVMEYSAEDYAQAAIDQAQEAELQEAQAKAEVNKAAAAAKLEALGLTADDLKALGL